MNEQEILLDMATRAEADVLRPGDYGQYYRQLVNIGWSYERIASHFGVSVHRVKYRISAFLAREKKNGG